MVVIATLGLLVNVAVARRLREHRDHSPNLRGYLHVIPTCSARSARSRRA
jgi:Co/Zn/Cd efflux system component